MQTTKSDKALAALESVAATLVRREWSEVRERLRSTKVLALTSHDRVDAVLLDPAEYATLVARAAEADLSLISTLTAHFDARLAALQQPDARDRLLQAFERNGQFDGAVVAGERF
jgi:PHD/YefM family antitoxin component YafN of YafNO toxin-antitoxin module